jgi:hypothetical protein
VGHEYMTDSLVLLEFSAPLVSTIPFKRNMSMFWSSTSVCDSIRNLHISVIDSIDNLQSSGLSCGVAISSSSQYAYTKFLIIFIPI